MQSRPFALIVRSQVATGPLPFEQGAGLLRVNGAAGQLGSVGIATGSEVQLDDVKTEALSPINLEDFPASVAPTLAAQIPGLTVRRAFRYADPKATAALKASRVAHGQSRARIHAGTGTPREARKAARPGKLSS